MGLAGEREGKAKGKAQKAKVVDGNVCWLCLREMPALELTSKARLTHTPGQPAGVCKQTRRHSTTLDGAETQVEVQREKAGGCFDNQTYKPWLHYHSSAVNDRDKQVASSR